MEMETQNVETKELNVKMEEISEKIFDMQDKMVGNFNNAMSGTAQKLDSTADKLHQTAKFIRNKNVNTLKSDITNIIEKHPGKSAGIIFLFGFLIGKVLSR